MLGLCVGSDLALRTFEVAQNPPQGISYPTEPSLMAHRAVRTNRFSSRNCAFVTRMSLLMVGAVSLISNMAYIMLTFDRHGDISVDGQRT